METTCYKPILEEYEINLDIKYLDIGLFARGRGLIGPIYIDVLKSYLRYYKVLLVFYGLLCITSTVTALNDVATFVTIATGSTVTIATGSTVTITTSSSTVTIGISGTTVNITTTVT